LAVWSPSVSSGLLVGQSPGDFPKHIYSEDSTVSTQSRARDLSAREVHLINMSVNFKQLKLLRLHFLDLYLRASPATLHHHLAQSPSSPPVGGRVKATLSTLLAATPHGMSYLNKPCSTSSTVTVTRSLTGTQIRYMSWEILGGTQGTSPCHQLLCIRVGRQEGTPFSGFAPLRTTHPT
jgi:hypothetical protein